MGLKSAAATLQRLMNTILEGVGEFVLVYIDDIVVKISWCIQQARKIISYISNRCSIPLAANIKLKRKKCCFGYKSIRFLGHEVSGDGISRLKLNLKKL